MKLSNSEILQKAIADGIIDINTLGKQIEMNERKKYLDMHKYNIWQGEKRQETELPPGDLRLRGKPIPKWRETV